MDNLNRFHTNGTWLLVRAENLALVLVISTVAILHARDIDWVRFIVAFLSIDFVGYIPGAIAYRRSGSAHLVAPLYHHLYNITHNYLTAGAVVALWALIAGHFEWAMLALPIHLAGDRGVFGNTYKPVSLPFEPQVLGARVVG